MSIKVQNVNEDSFKKYGRVLTCDYDLKDLLIKMEETPLPDDVVYVPSDKELESLPVAKAFEDSVYGGLSMQIGYCNGHNSILNALEYHRTSEINVAVTDLILLIGIQKDITDNYTYDTSNVEAFLVPKGIMVEVFATTLHYAPCGVDGNGFRCVVVLPKDTNTELETKPSGAKEDQLLVAKNKWLIAHKDANIEGAHVGLIGENISL